MNSFTYHQNRPQLTIEHTGGAEISNCYSGSSWKITSIYPLKKEKIQDLYKLGLVGFGQEFGVKSQCDGKEPPAGYDTVECVEFDRQGNPIQGPAINPYTDLPYEARKFPFYVYECWSRCDSGD